MTGACCGVLVSRRERRGGEGESLSAARIRLTNELKEGVDRGSCGMVDQRDLTLCFLHRRLGRKLGALSGACCGVLVSRRRERREGRLVISLVWPGPARWNSYKISTSLDFKGGQYSDRHHDQSLEYSAGSVACGT